MIGETISHYRVAENLGGGHWRTLLKSRLMGGGNRVCGGVFQSVVFLLLLDKLPS